MFSEVYWNQPVCPSMCPSICVSVHVQNTRCQSAGGVIKSHLVTALVFIVMLYRAFEDIERKKENAGNKCKNHHFSGIEFLASECP